MRLQKLQAWKLPLDFFDRDDAEKLLLLESVTCDAEPIPPRQVPPMAWSLQLLVIGYFLLIFMPLGLLLLFLTLLAFGTYLQLGFFIAVTIVLASHPLPHSLTHRRNKLGVLIAQYFALEYILDRDNKHDHGFSARVATSAVKIPDSEGDLTGVGPFVNLACPHGVINFGAVSYCFMSRWLVGSDQTTCVADVVASTPGLRHFVASIWPISASAKSLGAHLKKGEMVGLCPDGISGIFESSQEKGHEVLMIGKRRGLMKLLLQHSATVAPIYFCGTNQLYTIWQDRFGILRALSRKCRASLFFFHGRWGLPIPRRHPVTAICTIVPPPSQQSHEPPSAKELEDHHDRVYGALKGAFESMKCCAGLPASAHLTVK